MKYNQLDITASKKSRRVGRGIAAGRGKTAGRGTKGQGSRSGNKKGPMFEGGSRPIIKAIPKIKGFKSKRQPAQIVYLDHLNDLKGQEVDNFLLFEQNYIKSPFVKTKVITRGEISVPVTLKVQAISASAKKAIEAAGGSFIKTELPARVKQTKTKVEK